MPEYIKLEKKIFQGMILERDRSDSDRMKGNGFNLKQKKCHSEVIRVQAEVILLLSAVNLTDHSHCYL